MTFAVIGLLVEDGKVLATSRRGDTTKWGLPGGKIEDNETPYQAFVREMKEETGISVFQAEEVFTRPIPPNGEVKCYKITDYLGPPTSMEKGIEVAWKSPNDLVAGPFGEWNIKLFQKMNIPFDNCLTYSVKWDVDAQMFVGLCDQFPKLSSYNNNVDLAWKGIRTLVKKIGV